MALKKRILFFIIALFFSLQGTLNAQFIEYNHPELHWQSFETEHFVVHFHQGTKRTALLVGKIAEEIYPTITGLYDYRPKDKIHFIIKDTDDYSNGGSFFFDNKIEIWASNLDYIMRGTKNWLRDVVTHEYTHMISIQKMIKTNLLFPYGFIQIFGYEKERRKDVVRGFPNVLVSYPISSINIPVWFAEGTAQHQAPGARYDYRDPNREMIIRDRILYEQFLTYNSMTVFGKSSHGNESAYNLGFSFVNYLTNRFGESVLEKITELSSHWLNWTFEGVLEKATGYSADELYKAWKDSLTNTYLKRTEVIRRNLVKGKPVETEGTANLYPVWSPDGKLIAYVSNKGEDYFSQNRLILYDTQSGKKRVIARKISSSLSWSPDGKYLAYARQERNGDGSAFNDLFLYDVKAEKEFRLTKNLRGRNPDFSRDGKKLVFVTETNGLNQLNIYYLPENPKKKFDKTVFFDAETGALKLRPDDTEKDWRKVEYKGGKIEQVLRFDNGRQIYHPRWKGDDKTIIFDTAIDYGRDIAEYDPAKKELRFLLNTPVEERYPFVPRGTPYLYYASANTGIYNIYRKNLNTGKVELLTNVTGGAVMPSVDARGRLVYAAYDSLGYHIYRIDNPKAINPELAVYQPDYIATIPKKDFDNSLPDDIKIRDYKQMFGKVHILPRLMIDYGTVKPGFYLVSDDVLGKYNLIGGATVNKDMDYDLYAYFQMNIFKPSVFLEVFNTSANIGDTLSVSQGGYSLVYNRDVNFDLTEARIGLQYYPQPFLKLSLAGVWRRYNAKIDNKKLYDPIKKRWEPPFTFHYTYLKGYALELKMIADMVHQDRNKHIAPSGGRYVSFFYNLESSDFLKDFAISPIGLKEVYDNFTYNQFELDWEEYFRNPLLKSHTFSVRLNAGYIDRKVDSFFHLYAGGLIGMKGYSYFSIEGRHKLIATFSYRFPIWSNMDKLLSQIYFDKLYFGVFFDYGNAWEYSDKRFSLGHFKKDIGLELRLNTFSYSLFPTRFFAEAVYPLDEIRNYDDSRKKLINYPKEWRFYFGALYDFDLRERLNTLGRMAKRLF
ncbi:MAG: hypothetical protein GXO77_10800 [Calditrichaeota bacterium]|nr:hypothetical protein [Calditrichota bacterium]